MLSPSILKIEKKILRGPGGKGWGCNNTPTSKQRDRPHSGDIGMDNKKKKKTTLLFWRMSAQTILADAFHLKSHFGVRHEWGDLLYSMSRTKNFLSTHSDDISMNKTLLFKKIKTNVCQTSPNSDSFHLKSPCRVKHKWRGSGCPEQ